MVKQFIFKNNNIEVIEKEVNSIEEIDFKNEIRKEIENAPDIIKLLMNF